MSSCGRSLCYLLYFPLVDADTGLLTEGLLEGTTNFACFHEKLSVFWLMPICGTLLQVSAAGKTSIGVLTDVYMACLPDTPPNTRMLSHSDHEAAQQLFRANILNIIKVISYSTDLTQHSLQYFHKHALDAAVATAMATAAAAWPVMSGGKHRQDIRFWPEEVAVKMHQTSNTMMLRLKHRQELKPFMALIGEHR